ncbi:GTPase Era involved in 16S rRNA processing [Bacillus ectoiniformans]|nr:dynamin family protein [Bacillus ectoiniformans]MBM7649110.1 GTPase Era involved in 16S rRNA processing [Bacillus ectoiniformans]
MKLTQSSLIEALEQVKAEIHKAGDENGVQECEKMLEKMKHLEYVMAFCGHFSAGKSTMINELMGTDLLPSNPIPTSANVVKITSGEPYVKVGFTQKEEKIFSYPYNLADVQDYCTDGDLVEYVEISHDTKNLPPHIAILDTPGIDSTDDAHRVAAESRLYLADLVIYMMDYNHVQSEVNYQFIQELSNKKKKTFLIINQIDKHLSSEGSFEQYKEQIVQSFQEHEMNDRQIFFTSMKEINYPYNQLAEFKETLAKEISKRKSVVVTNIQKESLQLIKRHMNWKREEQKQEVDLLQSVLNEGQDAMELLRKYQELQLEQETLNERAVQFEPAFHEKLKTVLTNANLIPYHTREYAREFLDSRQFGFRAGGLFSRKKTKQEMEQRLDRFHESLCSNIDISLHIHVKKLFEDYYQEHDLYNDHLRENIQRFKVELTPDFLIKKINRGAILNNESARIYCSLLIDAIHQLYTRQALAEIQEAQTLLNQQLKQREKQLGEQLQSYERKLQVAKRLAAILEGNEKTERKLYSFLDFDASGHEEHTEEIHHAFVTSAESRFTEKSKGIHIGRIAHRWNKTFQTKANIFDESVKDHLRSASAILSRFTDLKSAAVGIERKLEKVNNRRFTIALFGAFSAGKSSFANALMGKRVLPVSPNPTTATINEILPPDSQHLHGTVRLFFKKEQELIQDINQVLDAAGLSAGTLEELEKLVRHHDHLVELRDQSEDIDEKNKEKEELPPPLELVTKQGMQFLRSVLAGRSHSESRLGSIQQTDSSQFERYVQSEEKACYIEKVQLYYDCPLTRKGIILVDTPGADSINSRHTEVAFEYTTKADAVLFVTYYNHAFSKADREFLIQLGRVKDYFDKDKMFFLVNACDLASAEQEIEDVLTHVEKNLLTCGIRDAQIFPVSSHIALLAQTSLNRDEQERYKKLTNTNAALSQEEGLAFSGIKAFNDSFFTFIFKELPAVVIQSAITEVLMAKKTMARWIELQKKSAEEKKKLLLELELARVKSDHLIQTLEFSAEKERLNQEMTELLYFVKQRVFFRLRDEFNQIFTPSVLKSADQKTVSIILQRCLNELIRFVSLDVAQELRATAFRLEVYMRKMETLIYEQIDTQLKHLSPDISLKAEERDQMERPSFQEGLPLCETIDWKAYLPDISSGSAFFIEGMNLTLRDKLDHQLRRPVEQYIHENDPVLRHFCDESFKEIISFAKRDISKQIESHFSGQMNVLKQGNISNRVESSYQEIKDTLTYISSK